MEQITYRITLDAHKNGIQRTLQGFETSDKLSRKVVVNLMENGDTYEIPRDHVVAAVYVTTPSANEPSINECTIEGNTVVYDVLPIVEEGITEMQIKLIESRPAGAKKVLMSARFAVEVAESHGDEGAEQTQTFTALENALASALSVYNAENSKSDSISLTVRLKAPLSICVKPSIWGLRTKLPMTAKAAGPIRGLKMICACSKPGCGISGERFLIS